MKSIKKKVIPLKRDHASPERGPRGAENADILFKPALGSEYFKKLSFLHIKNSGYPVIQKPSIDARSGEIF